MLVEMYEAQRNAFCSGSMIARFFEEEFLLGDNFLAFSFTEQGMDAWLAIYDLNFLKNH